eukprot:scaffold275341_cov129-Cyclotella_meneghiniana.AAC.1
MVSSSEDDEDDTMQHDDTMDERGGTATTAAAKKFRQHIMMQRKGLVRKIWTFCHTVLTSKKKKRSDTESIHVLTFLENAVPYCENETCLKFAEVCLTLLASTGVITADMVRQSLSTLLSCLEVPQRSPEGGHRPNADSAILVYARCLLTCMGHMAGQNSTQQQGGVFESKLLAFKLLPN